MYIGGLDKYKVGFAVVVDVIDEEGKTLVIFVC